MTSTIEFTPEMVKEFRKAYSLAIAEGHDMFVFAEKQFLTQYAKYLLEYLEGEKL